MELIQTSKNPSHPQPPKHKPQDDYFNDFDYIIEEVGNKEYHSFARGLKLYDIWSYIYYLNVTYLFLNTLDQQSIFNSKSSIKDILNQKNYELFNNGSQIMRYVLDG